MPVNWLGLIKAVIGVVDEVLDAYMQDVVPTPTPSPTPSPTFNQPTPTNNLPSGQFAGQAVMGQQHADSYQSGNDAVGPRVSRG